MTTVTITHKGKPVQADDLKAGKTYRVNPSTGELLTKLPAKIVYDLSVLTVGDLLQELRVRGFRGRLDYIGDKKS